MDRSLIEIQAGYDEPMEDNLTWLAKNVHEWPSEGLAMMYPSYFDDPRRKRVDFREDKAWMQPANVYVAREDWQQRRAELQNKPSWDSISSDINLIQQGLNGSWYGHHDLNAGELPIAINGTGWVYLGRDGKVLGDWHSTLEKRPEKRELNPPTSSLRHSQAVDIAKETGLCSDGRPCGEVHEFCQDAYCADCPNEPPEPKLRFTPEGFALSDHSEQPLDMVKQERYKDANGEDWIDEFARTSTVEEFRGAMRFTIGKYNRRVGKKDEIVKEIRKMKDYCHRWELYELGLKHD